MLYALEQFPIMKNASAAKDATLPENDRNVAATILGGCSLANISLKGRAGGRLRHALGTKASDRVQYSRLLRELPGATQVAWEDKRPEEALRPNGSRDKSLVRRVAAMIERDASEAVLHPGKVSADTRDSEDLSGAEDQAPADFELKESVRQDLGQLRTWVERAHLSGREQTVYELDMRTDHDTLAIAEELKITPETVRQYRKRYRDKLRKVAGS
jgi:DNA-binding CsgD family transcriptional regulator